MAPLARKTSNAEEKIPRCMVQQVLAHIVVVDDMYHTKRKKEWQAVWIADWS